MIAAQVVVHAATIRGADFAEPGTELVDQRMYSTEIRHLEAHGPREQPAAELHLLQFLSDREDHARGRGAYCACGVCCFCGQGFSLGHGPVAAEAVTNQRT